MNNLVAKDIFKAFKTGAYYAQVLSDISIDIIQGRQLELLDRQEVAKQLFFKYLLD